MSYNYSEYISIFKALADQTRLKIVGLLSAGEMCACQLLDHFKITQPTLSYHMKILCDSGLVRGRSEGQWMYYSNNNEIIKSVSFYLAALRSNKDEFRSEQNDSSCLKFH
ncbi:metalloregulator ArsR/SmtB family transcription factor [Desulfosporosinus sp. PR]|uniref:ArsR/SmtB family transcription factor n=1 Tax=Candidatus Desulfosporosinus nitrosoreducens TaxID=3401928 RepID=UPI0027F75FFC|nr:metalloregulator ArsR/SmtB family transcription factor [Desulfosporosinus sp. PR]MDQ7092335.1 metalloregulator ArsR/SmtB family transcription factor [Desulfosporosinus sp. PR]